MVNKFLEFVPNPKPRSNLFFRITVVIILQTQGIGGCGDKPLAGVIYQLHHVEINASQDLIKDWFLPAILTPFFVNNKFFVLQNKVHHLVNTRRHISRIVDESPYQKKVLTGLTV